METTKQKIELINYDNQQEIIVYNFFLDNSETSLSVKKDNSKLDYTNYDFALNLIENRLLNQNKTRKKMVKNTKKKINKRIKKQIKKGISKKQIIKNEYTYTQLESFVNKSISINGYEILGTEIIYYYTFDCNKKKYKSKVYFQRTKNDEELEVIKRRVCDYVTKIKIGVITKIEESIKSKLNEEIISSIQRLETLKINNENLLVREFKDDYLNHFIYALEKLSQFDFNNFTQKEIMIIKSFFISIIDYTMYQSITIMKLLKSDDIKSLLEKIDYEIDDRFNLLKQLKYDKFLACYH